MAMLIQKGGFSHEAFLNRLQKKMKEKSMRWSDLADAAGLWRSTLSGVKHGQIPRTDTLFAIANSLETSLDYLVRGLPEEHKTTKHIFAHIKTKSTQSNIAKNLANNDIKQTSVALHNQAKTYRNMAKLLDESASKLSTLKNKK